MIRATLAYVKEKFKEYNRLMFRGALPDIEIRISRARRSLGQFVHPVRYPSDRPRGVGECHIRISNCMELPESELEDVIIHEMIHYYIWYRKIVDSGPHGTEFRKMMHHINHTHGRNLSVRHRSSEGSMASDSRQRLHILCVTDWKDGSTALTVCAKSRIFDIHRHFRALRAITSMRWYYSLDPYFNRFPRFQTPKALVMTDEMRSHLSQARACSMDGKTLKPL